jgi:hypothetical protein
MINFLRFLFISILISMLCVTSWASLNCPLFGVPRNVATHPWFIATLFDAYWGFITFYVWVVYKETRWVSKISWLVAILSLGNIAMSVYCLIQLFSIKSNDSIAAILVEKKQNVSNLAILLAILGIGVTVYAAII